MSTTRVTSIATAALLALVSAACGSATTSSPDEAAGTAAPTIDGFDLVASGAGATLIASVNDADGDMATASVNWGDGVIEQINAGFPGVRVDHAYAVAGVYAVSLQAVDASGNITSAAGSADLTALVTTSMAPPTTEATGTTTTTGPPPTTDPPTTAPPRTDPPQTDPPRTDPPQTTTTTPPPPAPEPVTEDLRQFLVWELDASAPDGAGGEGDVRQVGTNGAALRSYAWHGYNGSGDARAEASIDWDVTETLNFFNVEYGSTLAQVQLEWAVSGSGTLKSHWDRFASVMASVEAGGGIGGVNKLTPIANTTFGLNDEQNSPFSVEINHSGSVDTYVQIGDSELYFFLDIGCDTRSGGQAFALTNEGWCDFYEGGGITVDKLQVTLTPLPGYEIIDGIAVHAD